MSIITNLSSLKTTSFVSLSGNEDALPVIEDNVSFVPDIQLMMHGLGDSANPSAESAALIESIVLDQMTSLLNQASEISDSRGRKNLLPEDIIFLMRRNPKSLKRLVVYLAAKDAAHIHAATMTPNNETVPTEVVVASALSQREPDSEESQRPQRADKKTPLEWKKGRKKYCLAYLKRLNIEESDLTQLVDVVKEARLNRANITALALSPGGYKHFQKARCESFSLTNVTRGRFYKWLTGRTGWTETLSQPVLELLVYLAKETIACIIDMVMTLREESNLRTKRGCLESSAITPDDIREAMRRCFFHHATSLSAFSRSVRPIQHRRIIAI